jgi:hypothetical protein
MKKRTQLRQKNELLPENRGQTVNSLGGSIMKLEFKEYSCLIAYNFFRSLFLSALFLSLFLLIVLII